MDNFLENIFTSVKKRHIIVRTIMIIVRKPITKFWVLPKDFAVAVPPPRFWKPTGTNVKPITVISDPVTTGGNNFFILAKKPAIKKIKIPAQIIAPYIYVMPILLPIDSSGATDCTAQPRTTGRPIPMSGVRCNCKRVAIPHIKISIETK